MGNERNGTFGRHTHKAQEEALKRGLRLIPGGKKSTPEPLDFSDLRQDSFLRAHYLERNVPREAEFHHADWETGDFPDAG